MHLWLWFLVQFASLAFLFPSFSLFMTYWFIYVRQTTLSRDPEALHSTAQSAGTAAQSSSVMAGTLWCRLLTCRMKLPGSQYSTVLVVAKQPTRTYEWVSAVSCHYTVRSFYAWEPCILSFWWHLCDVSMINNWWTSLRRFCRLCVCTACSWMCTTAARWCQHMRRHWDGIHGSSWIRSNAVEWLGWMMCNQN